MKNVASALIMSFNQKFSKLETLEKMMHKVFFREKKPFPLLKSLLRKNGKAQNIDSRILYDILRIIRKTKIFY